MRYHVFVRDDLVELMEAVNRVLTNGGELAGGVAVRSSAYNGSCMSPTYYVQAVLVANELESI